jgi:hypothetical protein
MNEEIQKLVEAIRILAERIDLLEQKPSREFNVIALDKEHDRVMKMMDTIELTYSAHQTWRKEDKERWKELKARRDEIRGIIGIKY